MKAAAYTLIFLLALTSCDDFFDSPIDYDIETPPPSLVINGLMQPNTPPVIEISTSVPVFESNLQPFYLPNATAVMYENGVFWDSLQYDQIPGWGPSDLAYVSSKNVKPGQNYSIQVTHPGYTAASAITPMPNAVEPSEFKWISKADLKANLVLPALGSNQYYYIRFRDNSWTVRFRSNSPVLEYEEDAFDFSDGQEWFYWAYVRPELMDGKDQDVAVEFDYTAFLPDSILVELFVLEEDLYKQNRGLLNSDPDNPFSEPTQVHTNVQNGYGVFSAYGFTATRVE